MRGVFLTLLSALLLPYAAQGQAPTVRAYLDRTTVGSGQRFVLSVEIAGNVQSSGQPTAPDLSGFARFLGSGSTQRINIVNGRQSVSRTVQFTYLATETGTYEIGPVTVEVNGRSMRTEPLTIEVTDQPGATGADATDPGTGLEPDDLFIRATANRTTVYPNQPVVVEYRIYTRVNVRSFSITEQPATPGFLTEEFPLPQSPETSTEVIDGQRYTVATIKKTALFPTGPGRRTIEPMLVTTGVQVRRRSRDPFDDFFSMGSLLGRVVEYPVMSNPVTIDVQPLPGDPPDDFTGVVGSLSVRAQVDSQSVETDHAVTLTVDVEGQGNLRTLPAPDIAFPADIEVYPPDLSEQTRWSGDVPGGRRTYEYVMIPRTPGRKTIPPLELSYFDTSLGTYRTVRTAPIEIEVTGESSIGPGVAAGTRSSVRAVRDDIRFIETDVPAFRRSGGSGLGSPAFWIALVVPALVVGGAAAARRQRDRLAGDEAYARRRGSSRRARRRLNAARKLLSHADTAAFYGEAERALLGFLADRLNLAEAGFVRDDARRRLTEAGVSPETIDEYLAVIDACARHRYAPVESGPEARGAVLDRAQQAMAALERETS